MSDQVRGKRAPVDDLRAADPVLAGLIDRLEPIDLESWRGRWSLDSFGSLARAIVGKQIATAAATAIFTRLQALIGDHEDGAAIASARFGAARGRVVGRQDGVAP
jgi:3-methyladenine DNA glycosylase/8-oxoguanine DNA glycosylase